jgi:hypothetical protein
LTYLVFSKLQFNIAVEHCSQLEEKVPLDFAQILAMYEFFLFFYINIFNDRRKLIKFYSKSERQV